MKLRHLKPLRVVIAVAFFALTAALFLDFREMGAKSMAQGVLSLQFVPSLLAFLDNAALGAAGFAAVLGLTLLLGRVYCSTICPFGTMQDLISRLTRNTALGRGKSPRRKLVASRPHTMLRHVMLLLTVLPFLLGYNLLLNLLEPYSNFGRILSNLVRPLILALNNLAAPLAEQLGSQALYLVQWPSIAPASVALALGMLLLAGWLSARHGRLYCNTLCPVGTLLGLLAIRAPLRIRIDPDHCTTCGRCHRVCKADCIDLQAKTIDSTRCVSCYNCVATCPEQALRMGSTSPRSQARPQQSESGRRTFLLGLAAGGAAMLAGRAEAAPPTPSIQSQPTTIPEHKAGPVSPPGSGSVSRFTSLCTACHLCVSACPSQVLVPTFLAYGPSGMFQPQMDYASGYCNFDCTLCSELCPSGAILPLPRERKQRTQVGVAKFIKENCVVYTDNTNCGACSEHCPTKAVRMVPYPNAAGRNLVIPEVKESLCVGCGACEHACPTRPYRAIYVLANPVHAQAEQPEETKQEPAADAGEDFPF